MCLHDYRAIVAEAASVTSAVSEDKPHVIYDLQGRLTDKPARGVYIEDGWKRVVK